MDEKPSGPGSRSQAIPAVRHKTEAEAAKLNVKSFHLAGNQSDWHEKLTAGRAGFDKYLDDAYLAHLPQVRVVHGRGTGAGKLESGI